MKKYVNPRIKLLFLFFRAFYNNVAGKIIEVDAPGLGPADLTQIKYKNIPKDIYPIGEKWRP